jgi:4-amino-4-deoxy-L-arabinose transferase-like glycosyltransferase
MNLTKTTGTVFWFLIGVLFFIPFLGNVHLFDWDEINFAEIAREMIVQNNYMEPHINFVTFTEKPPLFFWLQALSMKCFGINEYAARFPNALLGSFVLPFLFRQGTSLKSIRFGMLWAMAYFGSILPALYFKSGIIDPVFNFFIFASLLCLVKASWKKALFTAYRGQLLAAGTFAALAILTKGPAAILIIGLTMITYFIAAKFKWFLSLVDVLIFSVVTLLVTAIWFVVNYLQTGEKFIIEFTIRQWQLLTTADAGHGGFLLYHFVVIFFGCFPAVAFMLFAFFKKERNHKQLADLKKWMSILFLVVLILFTLVNTKIVHYSSLCYYPLSFLAALSMDNFIGQHWRFKKWITVVTVISSLPFIAAPFAVSYVTNNMDTLKSLLSKDPFAVENMAAQINWSGLVMLPGILLLITIAVFVFLIRNKSFNKAFAALFIGAAIWLQLALFFYIKNVEGISQRANIEFWQTKKNEDCYFATYGYKSYTQLFYGAVKEHSNKNYTNDEWLLHGNIDKPVYISCKTNSYKEFATNVKDAKFLCNKNGFYFFERLPVSAR